ncbi:MAG: hypothetical protein QOF41_1156 [Methylobacteriaceae bacterium]|nr:hypothetical protein [Methylobacteriaceae bacterium]
MRTILQAGTLFVALGLGTAGAFAETNLGNPPPGGKGEPKGEPAPKAAPMQPAPKAGPAQMGQQTGPVRPGPQARPTSAGPQAGHHPSTDRGLMEPHAGPSHFRHDETMDRQPGNARGFLPRSRRAYGIANRWNRELGYTRPYGMRPQRFVRYGENPATWPPRYRRPFVHSGYGYHRTLRYGYTPRPRGYGPRYGEYAARPAYSYRRPAYAPRFSSYGYRPRVRYAYAETPYAYDLPRETYATGIFATASTVGLHTYDYAYTTRVRPIAAYAGATGSYAGGYPLYNRPLAPAYPTPGCDCD